MRNIEHVTTGMRWPCGIRSANLATAAAIGFLFQSVPASANSQDSESEAAEQRQTALDVIVVTARRVEENAQDVPLTVNILTDEALANAAAQRMVDIASLVPNVSWIDSGSSVRLGSSISIRGIKSGDSVPAFDPGVGVYIDDVYQASGTSFENSLLDISEIQVLKGPQGTLFGRNTTAGALVIRTRLPSLDEVSARADIIVGNYNLVQARAVVNAPLSDNVAVKLSAISRDRDGYNFNLVTGKRDVNDENHYGGQAQLLFQANDNLRLVARAHYYKDETAGETPSCYGENTALGGPFCPEHPTLESTLDRTVSAEGPNTAEREIWGASLHTSFETAGEFELTSVSAYSRVETNVFHDVDFVAGDYVRSGGLLPNEWTFSQELRLATPQDARLRGVFGLYYVHENKPVEIPLVLRPEAFELLGVSIQPPSPYANPQSATTDSNTVTDSYAIFGQGQFDVTDRLILEAGLRYTIDEKDFRFSQTLDEAFLPFSFVFGPPIEAFTANERWDALTGSASISYKLGDDALAYVRYARGYKSGGFNANVSPAGYDPRVPFDPEYVDSYEAGLKFETGDRRFRANLAAFTIDYKDLQVQVEDPITRIKRVGNDSSVTSRGIEADIAFIPLENLTVTASAGYQDVKSEEGNPLTNVPAYNATLNATYSAPISDDHTLTASVTTIYRDKVFLNVLNKTESPAYARVNARIGIETDQFGVFLWGSNLTDVARVVQDYGGLFAVGHTYINPPRTFGLEFTASF